MSENVKRESFSWEHSWQKLPKGGVIPEGGTSAAYETGSWRSYKPIFHPEACSHCLLCWVYCPDGAIRLEGDKVTGILYNYCKGCGICVHECPKEGALTLVLETVNA